MQALSSLEAEDFQLLNRRPKFPFQSSRRSWECLKICLAPVGFNGIFEKLPLPCMATASTLSLIRHTLDHCLCKLDQICGEKVSFCSARKCSLLFLATRLINHITSGVFAVVAVVVVLGCSVFPLFSTCCFASVVAKCWSLVKTNDPWSWRYIRSRATA